MGDPVNDPIQHELLRTRALFAVTYAVARYVPVPLVDDFLRERIALSVLRRSAAARGHVLEKAALAPLSSSASGCLGCLLSILWLPIKLILYPIRALLSLVLGVRWASRDLFEILALGRTFDRLIADGRFPIASSVEVQATFAREARQAFDRAMKGLDTQAVTGVLSVALGPLRKLVPAALRLIGHASSEETPTGVEAPASRIVATLDDPRVRALLETIDQRFDQALLEIRAQARTA
jgi:hypothetical protein